MKSLKNIYILLDLLIVIVTYSIFHFIKFGRILPEGIYYVLFFIYLLYWFILSVYYDKYSIAFRGNQLAFIKAIVWSSVLTLFLITIIVSVTDLLAISRQFLLNITFYPMLVEIVIISILRWTLLSNYNVQEHEESDTKLISKNDPNVKLVMIGASMLIIFYFIMIKIKTGHFYLYPWSERILLILFGAWIVSIVLTNKYSTIDKSNVIFYFITPYIKSGLIMLFLAAMVFFFFRIESLSRFLLFGTILIYSIFEIISLLLYFMVQRAQTNRTESINIELLDKENLTWDIEEQNFEREFKQYQSLDEINIRSIFDQIQSLEDKNPIIDFLEKNLNNIKINFYSSAIYSTITLENIEILRNQSKNLLVNLHKLNDIRRLNKYLITCHQKLIPDGLLVGYLLPIDTTFRRLYSKMPKLLFTIIYPFHFVFNRVFPKIPKINILYFALTKGKNRSISKAEMFGRLNFCGFKIMDEIIINNKLFFITKKIKTISNVTNPTYHLIVKLQRIGYNKELIIIHKFRTMHPYSEFLQKDIYEENELDISGKFKNDFRITSWGKIMRKFWIDELPQIYDWMQGRINLVGVRALSEHYYSLYPKHLQDLRVKFKPGIIPPYYVDMPKNLNEICASEERYLNQKAIAPLKTDIKYAVKAVFNIVFKGARSR